LLRHWWAVVSTPAGVHPQFDYQCKPVTNVSGLSVPGMYVFQLRAFDDLHMVTQNITIQVNVADGIEDVYKNSNEISFYPNPVSNQLTINSEHLSIHRIEIFSTLGEKIYSSAVHCASCSPSHVSYGGQCIVNCASIPSGIYFVKVFTDDKIISGRVVKL